MHEFSDMSGKICNTPENDIYGSALNPAVEDSLLTQRNTSCAK